MLALLVALGLIPKDETERLERDAAETSKPPTREFVSGVDHDANAYARVVPAVFGQRGPVIGRRINRDR